MKWKSHQDMFCPICGKLMKNELMLHDTDNPDEGTSVIECEDCETESVIIMNPLGSDE